MKIRKAFTLIELLVVIAIIAILAAILFPVFAQAKLMAKAAASTSNQKQIALAEIMYASDNDDFSCPATSWGNWSFPFWFGGTAPQTYCSPWSYSVLPYTKNMTITNDPTGPLFAAVPAADIASGWNYNSFECINPDYGYAYTVMSGWYTGPGDSGPYEHTIPSAQLAQSAATVMFTSRGDYPSEEVFGIADGNLECWIFTGGLPGAPLLNGIVDPPKCGTVPAACVGGWGTGTAWGVGGGSLGYTTITAGANTGGMSARAPVNQEGTVSFCDGHAKKLSWAQTSVGTNWTPTIASGSMAITNGNTYMWYINYNFGY
jgi:prepilin-type N-terminal cleavage/methylation domain-containing protein